MSDRYNKPLDPKYDPETWMRKVDLPADKKWSGREKNTNMIPYEEKGLGPYTDDELRNASRQNYTNNSDDIIEILDYDEIDHSSTSLLTNTQKGILLTILAGIGGATYFIKVLEENPEGARLFALILALLTLAGISFKIASNMEDAPPRPPSRSQDTVSGGNKTIIVNQKVIINDGKVRIENKE